MNASIKIIFTLFGVIVLAISTGCVTKGKYNDLLEKQAQLETERDTLATEVLGLEGERNDLTGKLEATRLENAALRGTYTELVSELQSEVEAGQIEIKELADGIRLKVSDELLFSSGTVTLDAGGIAVLARVAASIKDGDSLVFVEGHTDDVAVGPSLRKRYPTNWELAGHRAATVVRVLTENGVSPDRLRAVSRGPFAPMVPNDSEKNRAKNRRTEIILRTVPEV